MTEPAVFVDANVLLETVLKDRQYAAVAADYINSNNIVISPLSAHLLVHFGLQDGLELGFLLTILKQHRFTALSPSEVQWAIANCQGSDFEDALQIACAVGHNCREFVTFDKRLVNRYQDFIAMRRL